MSIILSEEYHIARKDHNCNACEYILNDDISRRGGYTIKEMREIIKAKRKGYKILKGEKYLKQVGIMDGDFYVYKAIPEIHDICIEHDLFRE